MIPINGLIKTYDAVLALDGLDPKGERKVKQLFQGLCDNGTKIFMSSHSLGVAETTG